MIDSPARLLARKADLLSALETLEADREEGAVDEATYLKMRERYEREAAFVLQQLDTELPAPASAKRRRPPARLAWVAGALAVGAAIALFLVSSLSNRSAGQTITGAQPTGPSKPVSSTPPALLRAQRAARNHPKNYDDLLSLGNAYLDAGQAGSAQASYLRAAKLAPKRPEAPTLSALLLASEGKTREALRMLHRVESIQPTFARAWFVDGLISSRRVSGFTEAVSSWSKFLNLNPSGPVAAQVRGFLRRLCVAHAPGITSAMRSSCAKAALRG